MSTPLGKTAWGFLLAALDLRINGVDLLADPVGWLLAVVGLWTMSSRHGGFQVAVVLAAIEVVASLPLVVTETVPALLSTFEVLLQTGFVFAVCTGLIATLTHRPDKAGSANVIRWLDLGLSLLLAPMLLIVGAATGEVDVLGPFALMLGVVGLAVAVWFVVLLFQVRDDPALAAHAPA